MQQLILRGVGVVISAAIGISPVTMPQQAVEPIVEVQPTVEAPSPEHKEVKQVKKLTEKEKRLKLIKENPKGCNRATEYIVYPDGECSPKSHPAVLGDWVEQCHKWAEQAGVVLTASAINLIDHESNCDPTICNPNGIACGIPQALPWTKMGCDLSVADAPCQIKWFEQYCIDRYGGFDQAWAFWQANKWY